jgi:sulfide:quinone oxidoreductase
MKDIVVVGSGFGALTAVRHLRRKGIRDRILLVSPRPEMFYYPSLIWVPAGRREERDLTVPLQGFFNAHRVEYRQAAATGLDSKAKLLRTDGGDIRYDALIVASGGRFLKKLPGIETVFTPCEGYAPCAGIRNRLAQMSGGSIALGFATNPKEPAAMRGGPMFEFLFGIDTLLRRQGRRRQFELVFFNPAPKPGKRLGEQAVEGLLEEMSRRGIVTRLGHKILGFGNDKVRTEGGDIHSDLTIFMPGMTGPSWLDNSDLPRSPGGFIQADASCRAVGVPGVFVAGDSGSFPGPDWMPKQAHMADLQARTAVDNLVAQLHGGRADKTFKTELICIVDSLDDGMLVFRDSRRNLRLRTPALHWSKRFFEWLYMYPYRRAG